jgi:hypothetical protein
MILNPAVDVVALAVSSQRAHVFLPVPRRLAGDSQRYNAHPQSERPLCRDDARMTGSFGSALIWIGGTGVPACERAKDSLNHRQGRLCHHYSLNFRHYRSFAFISLLNCGI